jgi:hypothetical protein
MENHQRPPLVPHEQPHPPKPKPRARRLVGALSTLLILAFAFYWYEYRPMEIRSDCALDSSERAFLKNEGGEAENGIERIRLQNEAFETFYSLCVRSQGLAD